MFRGCIVFVFVLLVAWQAQAVFAEAEEVRIGFNASQVLVGQTPTLDIVISNTGTHGLRTKSLVCNKTGSSLTAFSFQQYPPSVIAANGFFRTSQGYKAVSPGTTQVTCVYTATDTVTGATVTLTSAPAAAEVLTETRLYFNPGSSTSTATVGQTFYLLATYGNRGSTAFTNIQVDCPELGRSAVFISSRQNMTSLQPGQSGFVEYKLRAERSGSAPFFCSITATDASNGQQLTLPAPPVMVEVR